MSLSEIFKTVRDVPYKIPLSQNEADHCCGGKHKMLKELLNKEGFDVRYRVCSFLWNSLGLPEKISGIPHDDLSSHAYLEVLIDGEWVVVDATWDIGLKNILPVNEWDGKSNTKIAVKPLEIFSLQKSADIMNNTSDKEMLEDSKTNGKFYEAINNWIEENRISIKK